MLVNVTNTLLLATLAIMTGALVITGVPTKLGAILINLAGVNLAAMVMLAFVFGAILGTGLPPAPTYILVAIVIAPPIRGLVDPQSLLLLRPINDRMASRSFQRSPESRVEPR
jgi:TRAP-type uncharacterized transport system fused permease subunit